ncbi:MAG: hypothetical protein SFZ23_05065 [Planctomycetota bacterium]|nr:hypothetical protein [Planctomycetota bacterium]
MTWFEKIRLKVFAIVLGVVLAGVAVISFSAWPFWPVIGAAVAAFAVAVNTVGNRLSTNTCLGCGENLNGRPAGEYGVVCPCCGTLSEPRTSGGGTRLARALPGPQSSSTGGSVLESSNLGEVAAAAPSAESALASAPAAAESAAKA